MAAITEQFPAHIGKSTTIPEPGRRHQLVGAALVVLSTAAIAIVPTFAKLAYDGGSNTLTVITGRSIVTAAVCFRASSTLPLRAAMRACACAQRMVHKSI
jgi:hypothetical protein